MSRTRKRRLPAPGFAEMQALFQRAIVEGDETILEQLNDSSKEVRATLFGVYRNAYVGRLVEVLRHDYERLARYLAAAEFEELGRAYVRAHPSDHPNARWFGRHLPTYLTGTTAHRDAPELADLALLEKTLSDVFDAADGVQLTLADLAGLTPEDWPGVVFSPHPAARRIDITTNAVALWKALAEDADPAERPQATRLAEPERLIAWRPELTPRFRPMSYEEAMMWDEMAKGLDFGGLCEMVATYGGEDGAPIRAGGYLKLWIEAGMLAGPEDA